MPGCLPSQNLRGKGNQNGVVSARPQAISEIERNPEGEKEGQGPGRPESRVRCAQQVSPGSPPRNLTFLNPLLAEQPVRRESFL